MNNYAAELLIRARVRDLRRQAEAERLAGAARRRQRRTPARRPCLLRALVRGVDRLVDRTGW